LILAELLQLAQDPNGLARAYLDALARGAERLHLADPLSVRRDPGFARDSGEAGDVVAYSASCY